MFKRYPYTIGLLTVISFVVCVECPVVFVALFEEAGE